MKIKNKLVRAIVWILLWVSVGSLIYAGEHFVNPDKITIRVSYEKKMNMSKESMAQIFYRKQNEGYEDERSINSVIDNHTAQFQLSGIDIDDVILCMFPLNTSKKFIIEKMQICYGNKIVADYAGTTLNNYISEEFDSKIKVTKKGQLKIIPKTERPYFVFDTSVLHCVKEYRRKLFMKWSVAVLLLFGGGFFCYKIKKLLLKELCRFGLDAFVILLLHL